jgi:hypothetical protein
MKKKAVIFFNCHGGEIIHQLSQSNEFTKIYDFYFIPLYEYILNGYKYFNQDLINEHKNLVKTCDLIILQYIKKDRKTVHHNYIQSLLKKNCIIIKISHFTFSGYHYKYNIGKDEYLNENKSKDKLNNYINNLLTDKKREILNNLNNELEHIRNLDKFSDIKCYDFVKNNYKKYLLFYSRSYPTYRFFHYISQKILEKLNFKEKISPKWTSYAAHFTEVIFPKVKEYLNLDFDIKFNYRCNIIEYILCCKINNTNCLNLKNRRDEGRKHVKDLLRIMSLKKYT